MCGTNDKKEMIIQTLRHRNDERQLIEKIFVLDNYNTITSWLGVILCDHM